MRITLDIPDTLISDILDMSDEKNTKKAIIKALEEKVRHEKHKKLLYYKGKIDLNIDLDRLRDRRNPFD
jgi:hypothetical protein